MITFLVARTVSGPGFISAVITGSVLAGISWVTVTLGWRETPRPPGSQSSGAPS